MPTEAALLKGSRTCLLCKRCETLELYVSVRKNHEGLSAITSISDHCIIVDVLGEYKKENSICSKPNIYEGIPKPFINHNRHKYKMEKKNSYKYYVELYDYPSRAQRNDIPANRDCESNNMHYLYSKANEPPKDSGLLQRTEGKEILHQGF